MAVLTANGTRRETSARCGVVQSTTATAITLGSVGGGSARQSPTSRSNQFTERAIGVGIGGATVVVVVVEVVGVSLFVTVAVGVHAESRATAAEIVAIRHLVIACVCVSS